MIPNVHCLKCWPEFFKEIVAGRKTHDLRRNDDRDFQIGDFITLYEYDPVKYLTGECQTVEVTYITSAQVPCALSNQALNEKYCILSIRKV